MQETLLSGNAFVSRTCAKRKTSYPHQISWETKNVSENLKQDLHFCNSMWSAQTREHRNFEILL